MLAIPTAIQCDRCRFARSQVVMARLRHVAGREKSEWVCPDCRAVWAFVSETDGFVDDHVSGRRPSVCPCPLAGPLEVAREVDTRGSARSWLWVCAACGAGHQVGPVGAA